MSDIESIGRALVKPKLVENEEVLRVYGSTPALWETYKQATRDFMSNVMPDVCCSCGVNEYIQSKVQAEVDGIEQEVYVVATSKGVHRFSKLKMNGVERYDFWGWAEIHPTTTMPGTTRVY